MTAPVLILANEADMAAAGIDVAMIRDAFRAGMLSADAMGQIPDRYPDAGDSMAIAARTFATAMGASLVTTFGPDLARVILGYVREAVEAAEHAPVMADPPDDDSPPRQPPWRH